MKRNSKSRFGWRESAQDTKQRRKETAIQWALFSGAELPMRGGTIRDESSLGGLFDQKPDAPGVVIGDATERRVPSEEGSLF
jgi:hypothetical protein